MRVAHRWAQRRHYQSLLCSLNPQTELAKVDHPATIVIHDIKIEGISIT
jgi:hypothetical protein